MVKSTKPLIAVVLSVRDAVESDIKKGYRASYGKGLKVVAVRHPMPYGDLNAQKVQRFAVVKDLEKT